MALAAETLIDRALLVLDYRHGGVRGNELKRAAPTALEALQSLERR